MSNAVVASNPGAVVVRSKRLKHPQGRDWGFVESQILRTYLDP